MFIPGRDKKSEDVEDEKQPVAKDVDPELEAWFQKKWAARRDELTKKKKRKRGRPRGKVKGKTRSAMGVGKQKKYYGEAIAIHGTANEDPNSDAIFLPISNRHMEVIDNWFANGRDKTKALLDAGYAQSVATHGHSSIFGRADVKREIKRRLKRTLKRYDVSEDKIEAELAKMAFTSLGDFLVINKETGLPELDLSKASHEQLSALTELKATPAGIQFKLGEKLAALDKLARINGMYEDKVTVLGAEDAVAKLQAGRARMNKKNEEG